jgi:hypothetical protein
MSEIIITNKNGEVLNSFEIKGINKELNNWLNEQAEKIRKSITKTVYDVGKFFAEAQAKIKEETGTDAAFYRWCRLMSIKGEQAKEYIKYYRLNLENNNEFIALPLGVALEIEKLQLPKPERKEVIEMAKNKEINKSDLVEINKQLKQQAKKQTDTIAELVKEHKEYKEELERQKARAKQLQVELEATNNANKTLEIKVESTPAKAKAEIKGYLIDIESYIGKRVPVIKHYLETLEPAEKYEQIAKIEKEIAETLRPLK